MLEWSSHTVMSYSDAEHEYSSLSPILLYAVSVSDIPYISFWFIFIPLTRQYDIAQHTRTEMCEDITNF